MISLRLSRVWVARLALIPLLVYSVGVPSVLLLRGSYLLVSDWLLPYEVGSLLLCAVVVWEVLGR